jgi:CRISPR/Cas system-associated exonuclease Cas4 (RecB family)
MGFDLVGATNNFLCRPSFRGHSDCHLYPSEASVVVTDEFGDRVVHGGCLRAGYYRCTGEEAIPFDARSKSIFELGNSVEDMLVDDWKEMGIFVANSVRFQNLEYNLSGEIDAVLRNPETDLPFGVEIKSFYGYFATTEIFGNKSKTGKPKMNNLLQTLVYAKEFKDKLDHFKLFYEDRGDGSKKSFDIRVVPTELEDTSIVYRPEIDGEIITDFTVDDIYARYEQLNRCILQGTIPDRDYELYFSNERIERDHQNGKISDSKFNKFKRVSKRDGSVRYIEKDRPGNWNCSYCKYKSLCYG